MSTQRTSRRLLVGVNTWRWIERLITGLFAATIFLMVATVLGCLIWMFVYVWENLI